MTFTTTNFTALEIRQGYRLDNTYFGVCSNCGEHIHKSRFGNAWLHTIRLADSSMRISEYCPEPYES
jgi:RNA polymerase-binding transcription factor DksA